LEFLRKADGSPFANFYFAAPFLGVFGGNNTLSTRGPHGSPGTSRRAPFGERRIFPSFLFFFIPPAGAGSRTGLLLLPAQKPPGFGKAAFLPFFSLPGCNEKSPSQGGAGKTLPAHRPPPSRISKKTPIPGRFLVSWSAPVVCAINNSSHHPGAVQGMNADCPTPIAADLCLFFLFGSFEDCPK